MENKVDLGFWDKTPDEYALLKEESRKTILFPAVAELISLTKDDKILDYGGGDGGFLEFFISNDIQKYLYDPSKGMIEFAKKNRQTIKKSQFNDDKFSNNFFDAATLIHVVTVIRENSELEKIFRRIHELLKDKGVFVIGMTHPAFKNNYFSTFHTDFSTNEVQYEYLKDELPYFVHLNGDKDNEFVSFECYHRPISTVLNLLIGSGFCIEKVLEIEDKDIKNPHKKYYFPPFLIIKCLKQTK